MTTARLSGGPTWAYASGLAHQVAKINLGTYGIRAPGLVWDTVRHHPDPTAIVAASVLALISAVYLLVVARTDRAALAPRTAVGLCLAGVVVVAAGYAIFLTTGISLSPTGSNNRSAVIAAAGNAMVLVGALAWLTTRLPERVRPLGLAAPVAAAIFGASLLSSRLARDWTLASRRAEAIVAQVVHAVPRPEQESTILLDGFCRYVGPAVVFDAPWDLSGALQIAYRDSTLLADVASPDLTVADDGIHTLVYGDETIHPYRRLLVVNVRSRVVVPLTDAIEARRYFARYNPDHSNGCPPGRPGHGVAVF
jgi:hypothetical protein